MNLTQLRVNYHFVTFYVNVSSENMFGGYLL